MEDILSSVSWPTILVTIENNQLFHFHTIISQINQSYINYFISMDATIRRLKDLFPGMHYMQYSLCLIKNKERNRY